MDLQGNHAETARKPLGCQSERFFPRVPRKALFSVPAPRLCTPLSSVVDVDVDVTSPSSPPHGTTQCACESRPFPGGPPGGSPVFAVAPFSLWPSLGPLLLRPSRVASLAANLASLSSLANLASGLSLAAHSASVRVCAFYICSHRCTPHAPPLSPEHCLSGLHGGSS